MLPVSIKLYNAIIAMTIRILHASLKCARKAQIGLKIQKWIPILTTYPSSVVG